MLLSNHWVKLAYKILITRLSINSCNEPYSCESINIYPYNTYVNYKLTLDEWNYVNKYLYDNTNYKMSIISIEKMSSPKYNYYISVNMYNYINSLNKNKLITRCEVKTYVKNEKGVYGNLIMDYVVNDIKCEFNINKCCQNIDNTLSEKEYLYASSICPKCEYGNLKSNIDMRANSNIFDFKLNYNEYVNDIKFNLNRYFIDFMDNIFNYDGIYKKIYYDTSLTRGDVRKIKKYNVSFKFKDLVFKEPDSIFYFKNKINLLLE